MHKRSFQIENFDFDCSMNMHRLACLCELKSTYDIKGFRSFAFA